VVAASRRAIAKMNRPEEFLVGGDFVEFSCPVWAIDLRVLLTAAKVQLFGYGHAA